MEVLLSSAGDGDHLVHELTRFDQGSSLRPLTRDLVVADALPFPDATPPRWAPVFLRQWLPAAEWVTATSIRLWSECLFDRLTRGALPEGPWRLHIVPCYGTAGAGRHRCDWIRADLRERLRRHRRSMARALAESIDPFDPADSVAQLLLTGPGAGVFSIAAAPLPFSRPRWISPFPGGAVPVGVDKAAPSRAFAKLVEAEARLGMRIGEREDCVDLGASPGSWTDVALRRGAKVTAVDRSPLRPDLMRNRGLRFERGDAFRFRPSQPVDWLLCDVIAAPQRTFELLRNWLGRAWCRRFVVTLKFKGVSDYPLLDAVQDLLARHCDRFLLTRLCANRNEACAAGRVAAGGRA